MEEEGAGPTVGGMFVERVFGSKYTAKKNDLHHAVKSGVAPEPTALDAWAIRTRVT